MDRDGDNFTNRIMLIVKIGAFLFLTLRLSGCLPGCSDASTAGKGKELLDKAQAQSQQVAELGARFKEKELAIERKFPPRTERDWAEIQQLAREEVTIAKQWADQARQSADMIEQSSGLAEIDEKFRKLLRLMAKLQRLDAEFADLSRERAALLLDPKAMTDEDTFLRKKTAIESQLNRMGKEHHDLADEVRKKAFPR